MMYRATIPSPVGLLTLASDGQALTGLWLEEQKYFGAGLETEALTMPDALFTRLRETEALLSAII